MTRSRAFAILVAAALFVVALFANGTVLLAANRTEPLILDDLSGTCKPVYKPASVTRNRGESLHWKVVNFCATKVTVSLDFGSGANPLESYSPKDVDEHDDGVLKTKILKTAQPHTTYTFSWVVNGTKYSDPDIVIDT